MHLTNDIGTNAAAIMSTMRGRDFGKCEYGVVEQYTNISDAAEYLAQHESAIGDILDAYDLGFPGVFAYEVAEELGNFMGQVGEENPITFSQVAEWEAQCLMASFFLGNMRDMVGDSQREAYKAVLEYMRGTFECGLDEYEQKVAPPTTVKFELGTIDSGLTIDQVVYARNAQGAVRKGTVKDVRIVLQARASDTYAPAVGVDVKFDTYPYEESYSRNSVFTSAAAAMGEAE